MVIRVRFAALTLVAACSSGGVAKDEIAAPASTSTMMFDARVTQTLALADAGVDAAAISDEVWKRVGRLYSEHGDAWGALEWLVAHPQEAREALRMVILEPQFTVAKRRAYEALGRIGDERDVSFLAERLRVEDRETLQWAARRALAAHGSDAAEIALVNALRDPDRRFASDAVFALGERKAEAARVRLEGLLDDPDDDLRYEVIRALGKLGHEQSAEILRKRARVERDADVKKLLKQMGY